MTAKINHMYWFIVCTLVLAILVLVAAFNLAHAEDNQRRMYDARGNAIGTATTNRNVTTFRDARGVITGTGATNSQGTTIFRDSRGRTTGFDTRN
jgi:hypothetical protein